MDVMAFQESGTKELDGILEFIQANYIYFSDRSQVPDMVSKNVEQKWKPNWRNELLLTRNPNKGFEDVSKIVDGDQKLTRFYHIKVKNQHKAKIARECICYLENYKDLSNNQIKYLDLLEFKWKGVIRPNISIPLRRYRDLQSQKKMVKIF